MVYIQLPAKLNFEGYYSETCLNQTLNKTESCINQTIKKKFFVSVKINPYKPTNYLFQTQKFPKEVGFRQVSLYQIF